MESSLLEGIYTRWNHILSQLNVEIQWISGCRNEIADALSRTVFSEPSEAQDEVLMSYGKLMRSQDGDTKWIWKDGKGGYLDLINKRRQIEVQERTDTVCFPDTEISGEATVDVVEAHLLAMAIEDFVDENPKYGKSLHASYRGPFVVAGFAGEHKKSYLLRQVDGQKIKYSYHGDQLRPFRLREGYLITGNEKRIPAYQNLRSGKASYEVPKPTKYFEGSWTRKN
ncbi:hypothetical protein OnM2_092022 [Erysiphe neolycopersici]|uniref:Uncharacterized protein n=1 Tax=Erysiphe neolycopersici TaxID=212602 RepID=A0A420HC73_9PEZI|nr:hypothetical protein OnM2_092022 [Erysiphe neolycopersici]